jgi:hypothetical protein
MSGPKNGTRVATSERTKDGSVWRHGSSHQSHASEVSETLHDHILQEADLAEDAETTAVDHTNGAIIVNPQPAPDYAKMDAPSQMSFNTFANRVKEFVRQVNALPWIAERPTVDYIPGKSKKSRYGADWPSVRGQSRPPTWYNSGPPAQLDLLSSGSPSIRQTPHMTVPNLSIHPAPSMHIPTIPSETKLAQAPSIRSKHSYRPSVQPTSPQSFLPQSPYQGPVIPNININAAPSVRSSYSKQGSVGTASRPPAWNGLGPTMSPRSIPFTGPSSPSQMGSDYDGETWEEYPQYPNGYVPAQPPVSQYPNHVVHGGIPRVRTATPSEHSQV